MEVEVESKDCIVRKMVADLNELGGDLSGVWAACNAVKSVAGG